MVSWAGLTVLMAVFLVLVGIEQYQSNDRHRHNVSSLRDAVAQDLTRLGEENAALRRENQQMRTDVTALQQRDKDLDYQMSTIYKSSGPNQIDRLYKYIDSKFGVVDYSLITRAWPSNQDYPNRRYNAFMAYNSKISMALRFLEEGKSQDARTLTLAAISDLGLFSCAATSALISAYDLPPELVVLVADLAPRYTFENQESGHVLIKYAAKNPGC